MAGTYPDVPGRRMALDRDGTRLVRIHHDSSSVQEINGSLPQLNAEHDAGVEMIQFFAAGSHSGNIIFPELRDVVGIYHGVRMNRNQGNTHTYNGLYSSADTTNGFDGTWISHGTTPNQSTFQDQGVGTFETDKTRMRNEITSHSLTGVKALRWMSSWSGTGGQILRLRIHVFGSPSTGQAPDRLRLWHPTLNQENTGAHFDWGDVARSTGADKTFRVYNPSTLQANNVALTTEAVTDTAPSILSQHMFSFAGSPFATSLDIGNIPAGTASGVVTLRRTINAGASLGPWWLRVIAAAGTYS